MTIRELTYQDIEVKNMVFLSAGYKITSPLTVQVMLFL